MNCSKGRFFPYWGRKFAGLALIVLCAVLTVALSGCLRPKDALNAPVIPKTSCHRIVSLSPGITELVYALQLQDRLVGVTRFCDYPESATRKAKIGGFTDPSLEAITRLQPDLVLLQSDQSDWIPALEAMQIAVLPLDYHTVAGIQQAAQSVGQACQVEPQSNALLASFTQVETQLRRSASPSQSRPRVMVVVGGAMGSQSLEDVYVAAAASIYPQLVSLAGGQPAFDGPPGLAFAQVSKEGLLRVNPDVIFELVPTPHAKAHAVSDRLAQWHRLKHLKAVQQNRVYVLTDEVMVRPGPRYPQIAQTFARFLKTPQDAP